MTPSARLAPPAALLLALCVLRGCAAVQPLPAWKNNSKTGVCSSTSSCNNCNTMANCGLCNSISQSAYICLDTSAVVGGTGSIQTSDPRCDGAFTPYYGRCQACAVSASCGMCIQQAGCVWCGAKGSCMDSLTAASSCPSLSVPFGLSATAPDFTQSAMDAACVAAVPPSPTPSPSLAPSPSSGGLAASGGGGGGGGGGGSASTGAVIGGVIGGLAGAAAIAWLAAWQLGYFAKAATPLTAATPKADTGVSVRNPASL
jgi:hypothetical protein